MSKSHILAPPLSLPPSTSFFTLECSDFYILLAKQPGRWKLPNVIMDSFFDYFMASMFEVLKSSTVQF